MKKMVLGLTVLASLVCIEALELTQEQIKDLDKLCKDGNSGYCTALGEGYLNGLGGLSKDYQKAKFYLEKACKKGSEKEEYFSEACTSLGVIYENGGYGVVQQNNKKASELYALACDEGYALACANVGSMYYQGKGVPRDHAKAAGYFKNACEAGNWLGCGKFATYYYDLGNQSKAVQYFKKACELGRDDANAQDIPEQREIWQQACQLSESLR